MSSQPGFSGSQESSNETYLICRVPNCQRKFKREFHLEQHEVNEHYKCAHCVKWSIDYTAYASHVGGHGLTDKYCHVCGLDFETKTKLNIHSFRYHCNDLSHFQCYRCGFMCFTKVKLKDHLLKSHNVELPNQS